MGGNGCELCPGEDVSNFRQMIAYTHPRVAPRRVQLIKYSACERLRATTACAPKLSPRENKKEEERRNNVTAMLNERVTAVIKFSQGSLQICC